jgi:putative transposase
VRRLCSVLEVSPSGYYKWRQRRDHREQSKREMANQTLLKEMRLIHREVRQTYGSPRMHAELLARGYACSLNRVARVMQVGGIRAKSKRRWRMQTTDSRHGLPVAPNVLGQEFTTTAANKKWVADITYIPTRKGWLYLAIVLDLYSRMVVGWSMDTSMATHLIESALKMALQTRRPAPSSGLLHHSDRGSQYASYQYQDLLATNGIQASMSRTANVYDNAVMESFFSTIKTELIHHCDYATQQEATRDIFRYIEGFYNRRRRHSALGYLSPHQFEMTQPTY